MKHGVSGNRPALWQRVTRWREWWCDCGLNEYITGIHVKSKPKHCSFQTKQITMLEYFSSSLLGNVFSGNWLNYLCNVILAYWPNCFGPEWIHRWRRVVFFRVLKTHFTWSGCGSGSSLWMMEALRLKRSSGARVKMFGLTWTQETETRLQSSKFTKGDGSSCLYSACLTVLTQW